MKSACKVSHVSDPEVPDTYWRCDKLADPVIEFFKPLLSILELSEQSG
jgi:hypothetical protein